MYDVRRGLKQQKEGSAVLRDSIMSCIVCPHNVGDIESCFNEPLNYFSRIVDRCTPQLSRCDSGVDFAQCQTLSLHVWEFLYSDFPHCLTFISPAVPQYWCEFLMGCFDSAGESVQYIVILNNIKGRQNFHHVWRTCSVPQIQHFSLPFGSHFSKAPVCAS